jgi:hypothetical protein
MDKQQKNIFAAVLAVLAVALTVCAVLILQPPDFVPPPFDSTAVEGMPPVTEGFVTMKNDAKGSIVWGMNSTVTCKDLAAEIYFTSKDTNRAWLLVKLYGEDGALLGESGLICPGEYVKSIALSSPPHGATVTAVIYFYEPDTYYSLGSVNVNANLSVLP